MTRDKKPKRAENLKSTSLAMIAAILLERHVVKGPKKSSEGKTEDGYLKLKEREINSAVELARRIMLAVEMEPELALCGDGCNADGNGVECSGMCLRVSAHEDDVDDPDSGIHKCDGGHTWGTG
jgi:hypothetical protein